MTGLGTPSLFCACEQCLVVQSVPAMSMHMQMQALGVFGARPFYWALLSLSLYIYMCQSLPHHVFVAALLSG